MKVIEYVLREWASCVTCDGCDFRGLCSVAPEAKVNECYRWLTDNKDKTISYLTQEILKNE